MTKAMEFAIKEKETFMQKKELQLLMYKFNAEVLKKPTKYRIKKINLLSEKIKELTILIN